MLELMSSENTSLDIVLVARMFDSSKLVFSSPEKPECLGQNGETVKLRARR